MSGLLCCFLLLGVAAAIHLTHGKPFTQDIVVPAVLSAVLGGLFLAGPITMFVCALLLMRGVHNYRTLIARLYQAHRVCQVCGAVALFDDKYVEPKQSKGHDRADLVPVMCVIEEEGQAHVLCDSCLAEINHTDQR